MNNMNNMIEEIKLFSFLLSKLGLTENDIRWMYNSGISFKKEDFVIRKYLFDNIQLRKCFLEELLEAGLTKEMIYDSLAINDEVIDTFFEEKFLGMDVNFPKFKHFNEEGIRIPETEIKYSFEIKWNLFITAYLNKYNLLSYYETHKDKRNKIMNALYEKGIDYPEIGDIFNCSARTVRDCLINFKKSQD